MEFLYDLIPDRIKAIQCHMDFAGQKRAEKIFQTTIILFAIVGFVWGYICQRFSQTVYILAAGFLLTCLLTLPPWPMYRVTPLKWQPAREFPENEETTTPGGSKNKKKK